jgi:hypothetical protein
MDKPMVDVAAISWNGGSVGVTRAGVCCNAQKKSRIAAALKG